MSDVRLIDANAMRDDWLENGENEYVYDTNAVLESIDKQPTIDAVEVVHGYWEKVQAWKDNPQTTLRCSLCKTNQPIYEHDEWRYCPFCGMPMDAKDMDVPTKDGGAEGCTN